MSSSVTYAGDITSLRFSRLVAPKLNNRPLWKPRLRYSIPSSMGYADAWADAFDTLLDTMSQIVDAQQCSIGFQPVWPIALRRAIGHRQ